MGRRAERTGNRKPKKKPEQHVTAFSKHSKKRVGTQKQNQNQNQGVKFQGDKLQVSKKEIGYICAEAS